MTSAELTVDVVIPCWGSYALTLADAVRSAAGATTITVVGDEAARRVAQDEAVDFLPLDGVGGVSRARERGRAAGRSDAVCFLDADDALFPGALATMAATLAREAGAVAVTGRLARRGTDGFWPPTAWVRLACTRLGAPALLFRNCLPAVGGCLIRRERVEGVVLFPDLDDEDWHAAISLRALGRVVHLDVPLLDYAIDAGSLSRRPRALEELRRSQDQLLVTARRSLSRDRWWWELVDRVAARVRDRHQKIAIRRWTDVEPR